MKKILLLFTFGSISLSLFAQEITFSEHIAPIIYNNCTSCHRSGEIAPMSLASYEEVKPWAAMIQYVTGIKYMPPWTPDRSYSTFVGEKGLSDEEIALIRRWAEAGAPQGNPALEPSLPNFPDGSQLGTPDLVLKMEEPYTISGDNKDDYRVFVLPTGLTEEKEIAAIEFRPGNRRAVHHVLLASDTRGAGRAKDAEDPEYGFESFGGFGIPVDDRFTSYTPGIQTIPYPEGIGKVLPAGADMIIQVHYAPLPTDEVDQSSVNIFFKKPDDPISRTVRGNWSISPLNLEGGWNTFRIQPGQVQTFHATQNVPTGISLLNVYPHCHLLGESWEIFAVTRENDTIPIIKIDDWDFNWQGAYTFEKMKKIPAGSTIHCYATYDNTENNPFNPSFPPKLVTWGEQTTDEMLLVGMQYVPYQPGDEDKLVTDVDDPTENQAENRLYAVFPNPADTQVTLDFYLKKSDRASIQLFDLNGRLVSTFADEENLSSGRQQRNLSVKGLASGVYVLQIKGLDFQITEKLIISK